MREIRFRVWDKKQNKFLKYGEYSFHFNDYGDLLVYIEFGNYYLQLGEYIILEYTGLKDKNGKEIYEGDIVRFKDYGKWFTREVEYYGGGFTPFCSRSEQVDFGDIEAYKCKIIGNIYENKDLLTNK